MKDKEEVSLIIIYEVAGNLKAHVELENAIVTRTSAQNLTSAIVNDWRRELSLPSTATYDLFVKVPADVVLNTLNLDELTTIAILPIGIEAGPVYSRTKKPG